MKINRNSEPFINNKVYESLLNQVRLQLHGRLMRTFVSSISKKDAERLQFIIINPDWIGEIKDLEFLEHFPNVEEITLGGRGINFSLKGIRHAKRLETLTMCGVYIDDFTELKNCKNLISLEYMMEEDCEKKAEDFTFLSQFSNLYHLDLTGRNITDTSIFIHNTNLKGLVLDKNPIKSLKGLEQLPRLESLDITECGLTSLDDLENIKGLKEVVAEENKFTEEQKEMYRKKYSYLEELML